MEKEKAARQSLASTGICGAGSIATDDVARAVVDSLNLLSLMSMACAISAKELSSYSAKNAALGLRELRNIRTVVSTALERRKSLTQHEFNMLKLGSYLVSMGNDAMKIAELLEKNPKLNEEVPNSWPIPMSADEFACELWERGRYFWEKVYNKPTSSK